METVYVDVLFMLNFLLTGAMLGCTALLTHRHLTRGRMTMGSLVGGIDALFLLLPLTETVRTVCLWPVRILTAVGIILCAFGRKGERVANTPMRVFPPRRGGRTVGDQSSRTLRENCQISHRCE